MPPARPVSPLSPFIVEMLPMFALREAANQRRQHQTREWNRGGMKTWLPTHALCSPQKVSRMKPWVGLLARTEQARCLLVACLPRRLEPSGFQSDAPYSQWRDRAGFVPDFPVMPLMGTQSRRTLYHLWAARSMNDR